MCLASLKGGCCNVDAHLTFRYAIARQIRCIVFRFGGVWKRPPEFQTALKHVEQITRQILLSALLSLASSQFDF